MALSELKFDEGDFAGQDIASLDDRPKLTAAELKARFDNIGKAMLALGAFNKLVDALLDGEALSEIGVPGMDGAMLSEVLSELKQAQSELAEAQQGLEKSQQEMAEAQQELSENKAEADLSNVADEVLKERVEAVGITGSGGTDGLPDIGEDDDGKVVAVDGDEYALKRIAMLCTEVSNTSGGTTMYIESGMQ